MESKCAGGTQNPSKPASDGSGSSGNGSLSTLLAKVNALLAEAHAERLRRWAEEYPPGHGDREARMPTLRAEDA